MDDEKLSHHVLDLELLPVRPDAPAKPLRPPLPVAEIYPMEALSARLASHDGPLRQPAKLVAETRKGSIFFRARGARDIESDPFLKRLSRLN